MKMKLGLKKSRLSDLVSQMNWDNGNPDTNGEYFLLKSLGTNWKVCFDIGANRGDYTKFLKETSPHASIVSFEPNPKSAEKIKKGRRVKVEVTAVGDKGGAININFNQDDDTQSSTYRKNEHTKPTHVQQISIDDYLHENKIRHIDFIKIDTEGHELAVIKGAKRTIERQQVDFIQFEYGGTYLDAGTTLASVYSKLLPHYIVCHILPNGLLPIDWNPAFETYRYSNWLAISRKLYKAGGSK